MLGLLTELLRYVHAMRCWGVCPMSDDRLMSSVLCSCKGGGVVLGEGTLEGGVWQGTTHGRL